MRRASTPRGRSRNLFKIIKTKMIFLQSLQKHSGRNLLGVHMLTPERSRAKLALTYNENHPMMIYLQAPGPNCTCSFNQRTVLLLQKIFSEVTLIKLFTEQCNWRGARERHLDIECVARLITSESHRESNDSIGLLAELCKSYVNGMH